MDLAAFPSPCYVLNARRLRANLARLRALHEATGAEVLVSLKAFALRDILPRLRHAIQGGAAASLYEARLCYETLGKGAHTYAVAYKEAEFQDLLRYSHRLSFNSVTQWQRFYPRAKAAHVSCGLRFNPHYSAAPAALYDAAQKGNRLGIPIEDTQITLQKYSEIEGIHIHNLCEAYSDAFENTLKVLERYGGSALKGIKWINIGGGHLITDSAYDVKHLEGLLLRFSHQYGVQIIIEPGSAVVWQAGGLIATVLDIVPYGDTPTAILDVSFTCHMPDCLEMPYRPRIQNADLNPSAKPYAYKIGGLSCLAGDHMDAYGFEKPLKVGDRLLFEDMLHYTFVKSTYFNGIPHPAFAVWEEDNTPHILKRFDYTDYVARMG